MNMRLKALVVEDHPVVSRGVELFLRNIDIETEAALNYSSASNALDRIVSNRSNLDIIITGMHLGRGMYEGVNLITRIRNMPDQNTVLSGSKLKRLPIIVLTGGGFRHAYNTLPAIDPKIIIVSKDSEVEVLIKAIDDSIRSYRREILSELQYIGLALVWENGHYQVINAYAQLPASQVETTLLSGETNVIGQSYSRLVLISDKWAVAQIAIDMFESLLNAPRTTERDFQQFLELHPEFLLGDEHDSYWAEPILKSPANGRQVRPDFILQPRVLRSSTWRWTLVDLKKPNVPLITHTRFHTDLSHHVYRVATQLKDYAEFFADPRNKELIQRRFGGVVPMPKLVAVIGRLPVTHKDEYAALRSRLTGVTITTYDELLEFRRAKIEWMKSLGSFQV